MVLMQKQFVAGLGDDGMQTQVGLQGGCKSLCLSKRVLVAW